MRTLIIATRNGHKLGEIRSILGELARCMSLKEVDEAPEVVEDQGTFAGNAEKKAVELAGWLTPRLSGLGIGASEILWVLADDSGLEVDALEGAPGVHSARFAASGGAGAGNASDAANNEKLLKLLEGVPTRERSARFRCVLALAGLGRGGVERPVFFEGTCEGRIDGEGRGEGGFGYDPLFIPDGYEQSFAVLGAEEKNRISHRAKALGKLREFLSGG